MNCQHFKKLCSEFNKNRLIYFKRLASQNYCIKKDILIYTETKASGELLLINIIKTLSHFL